MKTLIFTLALMPAVATAQGLIEELEAPTGPANSLEAPYYPPPYGIAVQPVLPVPRDRGPWGTGYSIITETRERPDMSRQLLGDWNATRQQTIQKWVPNDALGNPINPYGLE
jgi:hypothetical protein